ncbi:hypothetical protein AB0P40_11065 [Streptomyces sp. NPDC079189]|uniref:hypothetical protein n=1 Tax=Streptomyces sp. NPDC079189 TaxID=3154514 RepID=UPI0034476FBD
MNHTFGRRAATAAVAFTAIAGTLLAAGGAASAAPNPAAGHAAVASHTPGASTYGDHRGDRNDHRGSWGGRDGDGHRWGDQDDRRGDWRWDGHRRWERQGRYWYSNDHGHRYRFDNHRFYQWERGIWVVVIGSAHDFDYGIFR